MGTYKNSASSFLEFFAKIEHCTNVSSLMMALNVDDEITLISTIASLLELSDCLLNDISEQAASEDQRRLWMETYNEIKLALDQLSFSMSKNTGGFGPRQGLKIDVPSSAITGLKYIAQSLQDAEEDSVYIDVLDNALTNLDRLAANDETLSPQVRLWVRDMIRTIRDGISRYRIFGNRGMKRQFHELIGQLSMTWKVNEKEMVALQENNPELWSTVREAIDAMYKLSYIKESVGPLLESTVKFISDCISP